MGVIGNTTLNAEDNLDNERNISMIYRIITGTTTESDAKLFLGLIIGVFMLGVLIGALIVK